MRRQDKGELKQPVQRQKMAVPLARDSDASHTKMKKIFEGELE
jgi:hypothetical protein